MDIKLSCGITGSMDSEIGKEMKTIVNNYSAHAARKFLHSTANSVLLGDPVVCIRSFAVFRSTAKTTGGFEYAGE